MEPALLLCLAGGTIFSCLWLWHFRESVHISRWAVVPIVVLQTVVGLVSVKLFSALESFDFSGYSGMRLYGAIFFMPVFYYLCAKWFSWDIGRFFDVQTFSLIVFLIITRISCIVSGCCQGLPLPGGSTLCWPTREVEMVFHGVLLVLFYRRLRRQEQPGTIYPLYMMAYGAFRFVEEWFREGKALFWGLHPAHFWSLLSIVIGCSFYFELKARNDRKSSRAKRRR